MSTTTALPFGEPGVVHLPWQDEPWQAVKDHDGAVWLLSPGDSKWTRKGPDTSALLLERHFRKYTDAELLALFSKGLTS